MQLHRLDKLKYNRRDLSITWSILLQDLQLVFTFHGTLQAIHAMFCHSIAFNSIREQDGGPVYPLIWAVSAE